MILPPSKITICIDGKQIAYGLLLEGPEKRLIFTLDRHFKDGKENDALDVLHLARVKTFKSAFARMFPDAPKFHQTSTMCGSYSEWKYFFSGAKREHIEWAKDATHCGLIDSYIVDYDPASGGDA